MQKQSNQLTQNVQDIVKAFAFLVVSINTAFNAVNTRPTHVGVQHPALPGTGGLAGDAAASGGSAGNTRAIPPRVAP
jgi:hypothetical protein